MSEDFFPRARLTSAGRLRTVVNERSLIRGFGPEFAKLTEFRSRHFQMDTRMEIFAGCCACSVGGLFALVGCLMALKTIALLRHGVLVRAVVVEHARDPGDEGTYPVVEFQDVAGRMWRVRVSIGSRIPIGQSLDVLYDERDPMRVQTLSVMERWVYPAIVLLGGGISIALGLWAWSRPPQ